MNPGAYERSEVSVSYKTCVLLIVKYGKSLVSYTVEEVKNKYSWKEQDQLTFNKWIFPYGQQVRDDDCVNFVAIP